MNAVEVASPGARALARPRRALSSAKRRARVVLDADERRHAAVRRRLAAQHLSGNGLEIGALHQPLRLPRSAHARYVDRMTVPQLRRQYPELARLDLVTPDVIDDGETLGSVEDGSVDFVIANHLIEHCQDPIGTLKAFARVLAQDGVLYMAVPDARKTFDRRRPLTPLEHIVRDHVEGPAWSRSGHFEEWVGLVGQVPADLVVEQARELDESDYSIHFHVWTLDSFLEFLVHCTSTLRLPFAIESVERNGLEFVVILHREAETGS